MFISCDVDCQILFGSKFSFTNLTLKFFIITVMCFSVMEVRFFCPYIALHGQQQLITIEHNYCSLSGLEEETNLSYLKEVLILVVGSTLP